MSGALEEVREDYLRGRALCDLLGRVDEAGKLASRSQRAVAVLRHRLSAATKGARGHGAGRAAEQQRSHFQRWSHAGGLCVAERGVPSTQ